MNHTCDMREELKKFIYFLCFGCFLNSCFFGFLVFLSEGGWEGYLSINQLLLLSLTPFFFPSFPASSRLTGFRRGGGWQNKNKRSITSFMHVLLCRIGDSYVMYMYQPLSNTLHNSEAGEQIGYLQVRTVYYQVGRCKRSTQISQREFIFFGRFDMNERL